ncbi:MAG TPA: asparagine synthase-related protein [Solirubrobacteraceae bacterium]|jgi:asparagine synthase (glutamine-hydrolysing)|nr:asparagine synthase-related protein [Solirubrobacteraceae bacterium]
MLAGAWGAQASELLERAAERLGTPLHRDGALAMLAPPDIVAGPWCCWLFGEPRGRAAFAEALTELGEMACERLSGRFVLVAVDRDRPRCLVIRDQLGAEPLVYAHAADGVLFATHERDLLDLLTRTPSPDRLALLQWIENGLTPLGHTLYEGMQRLPAGQRLILGERHARVERWWSLRYEGVEERSATALADRLREAAFAAVARAAAGSRRPAVKLSGGLDSACVAAGLAASGFADGRALAIAGTFSAHPEADEGELIEATARHTHLPLELIAFDADSSMLAPALAHIARWRLPPTTSNLFLWQPLMARARELGVDLMLDGEGGDELFGLAPYLIADVLRAGRLRTAWSLTGAIPGIGHNPGGRIRLRALRRYGMGPLLPTAVQRRRERRRSASSPSIVPPADAQALVDLRVASWLDRRDGPVWWRLQAESLIDMHDLFDLGAHFRREAVDEAVERRHPFLYDLQLTEAVLRLPPRLQFDSVRDRLLLREALRGLIPEGVRTRHVKSHFTPLVLAGIRADESGLIEPLRQPDAPVRAYVAQETLDRRIGVAADERSMLGAGAMWRVAIANRWLLALAGA